ncbi:S41 family peptidase [Neomegalonema sp.]|uniref:S41 family peptidase n=1 Tax=Neomegalonema sp. TaxID=2039713 RepID=UPI002601BBD4|nr:S41 family peptidase [Neomegalonema sp.]MDD2867962.1 S41 family peptidase [Neomegalonema sp.]
MNRTAMAAVFGLAAGLAFGAPFIAPSVAQETATTARPAAPASDTYDYLNLFGDVFERMRKDYVEPIDDQKVLEAAINGMLASLDPHSGYMPPEAYKDMQTETRGEFGGLGMEVTMENGILTVVSPIDETPAARAGIRGRDVITHIDGESVDGLTLNQAVEKMRGPIKSKVTLSIYRAPSEDDVSADAKETFDLELERDVIRVRAVRWEAKGDIGYLRMTRFSEQTYDNLEAGIKALKEEIGEDKLRGYVLDLRNNPGGLLSQAVAVSDAFLERGEIVSTRGREPRDADRYNAQPGDLTGGLPIVVLVNGSSASAAEIVAGALQDHRRGVVVGQKTFGKGSVQTIMPLAARGAIRLTTARYYTPSGRSIQGLGIEPDIVVGNLKIQTPEAAAAASRSEASLRNSLANKDLTEEERARIKAEHESREAAAKLREEDYQLSYAVDLLHGLAVYRDFKQAAE